MTELARLAIWTALASGIAIGGLGLLLLVSKVRRAHTRAFGVFLLVWSAVLVAGNLSNLAFQEGNPALSRRFILLHAAFLIPAYVPLAYFAASYPARRAWFARSGLGAAVLVAPAALMTVAYVLDPSLAWQDFVQLGASVSSRWGPLYLTSGLLLSLAFYFAIAILERARARASSNLEVRRNLLVLLALVLYVGAVSGMAVVLDAIPLLAGTHPQPTDAIISAAEGALGLTVVLIVGARVVSAPADRRLPSRPLTAAAFAVPVALGAASGYAALVAGVPPVWVVGALRLLAVAVLAHAILRFELFEIDDRVQRAIVAAGLFGIAVAGAVALEQGLETVLDPAAAVGISQGLVVAVVLLAFAGAPRISTGILQRLFPGPPGASGAEARRLEVYEVALQQALADGDAEDADGRLADLRLKLGITDFEHDVLTRVVRGAAPATDGGPTVEAGTVLADRYELVRQIGLGASGGVAYLAVDRRADDGRGRGGGSGRRDGGAADGGQDEVVVKVLKASTVDDPDAARAFLREGRLAAGLAHPRVVEVRDYGTAGATPYIVMEHVAGGSLEDRLADEGRLLPAEAVRLTLEVLEGLEAVHARGVLHRDLKPSNVLVTADGHAKLADFGIAVALAAEAAPEAGATYAGLPTAPEPAGTPAYMAPEALQGGPPTPAVEVYAVGAMLYEMLTGRTYLDFAGMDYAGLVRAVTHGEPRPFGEGVPGPLAGVVERALAKDPADRFAGPAEMRRALEALDL